MTRCFVVMQTAWSDTEVLGVRASLEAAQQLATDVDRTGLYHQNNPDLSWEVFDRRPDEDESPIASALGSLGVCYTIYRFDLGPPPTSAPERDET